MSTYLSMSIEIKKRQPLSFYVNKYHIPIISEGIVTFFSRKKFEKKFKKKDLSNQKVFNTVAIEALNRCNLNCTFCPANRDVDIRKPTYMKKELFYNIIKQLKDLNYKDNIVLSINNEPLLDKRLEIFIKMITTELPDVESFIYTNGTLLNTDRLKSLYEAGLKKIIIDNYNTKLVLLPNIKKILDEIKGTEIEKNMNIIVGLRYKNAILTYRAGRAPNKKGLFSKLSVFDKKQIRKRGCEFPFEQININPEGNVLICCVDVYYTNIIGNLKKEKLIDIWNGEKFTEIRKNLIESGRNNINPCKGCDKL